MAVDAQLKALDGGVLTAIELVGGAVPAADVTARTALADILARLLATLDVVGAVAVSNLPATQPVSGPLTDTQLRAAAVPVADVYTGGEVLADQSGAGAALTFAFSSPVQLVWVRCDGADGRADPFGGTPSASVGIVCEDGVPNPLTVQTSSVKVFAAAGTVSVWGFRN